MPRPMKGRQMFAEAHLAQRIAVEREARGWSYDGLAERMKGVGCNIHASALYKIEKGSPPRRVTVDELVALSQVFNLGMTELVADPRHFLSERAARLAEKTLNLMSESTRLAVEADKVMGEAMEVEEELAHLLEGRPEVAAAILKALDQRADEFDQVLEPPKGQEPERLNWWRAGFMRETVKRLATTEGESK